MITKRIFFETRPRVEEEFEKRFGIKADTVWAVGVDVMDSHGLSKVAEAILVDDNCTYIWKPGKGLAIINSVIEPTDMVWCTYACEEGSRITYSFKGSNDHSLQLAVESVEAFTDQPL